MKKLILKMGFALALGAFSLWVGPAPLVAGENAVVLKENILPVPPMVYSTEADFSDAEFKTADQPEQGLKTGGDVIVVSAVTVVVIVAIVVLLILL